MSHSFYPFPDERPICPVDALPDGLRNAVLYAIVKKGVPPAIALIDAIAASAAVVHCGYDCVTPDGELMAATLYTLASAPSATGKGTSYRILFRYFIQAMKRDMAERANTERMKANHPAASGFQKETPRAAIPTVEGLVTEMTYFAFLKALHGEGMNAAIQDEDAATFFESELFKHQLSRLTQAWSGDPPISRAYGSRQLRAVDARCSIGLRTQPDILGDVPESRLRMAINVGFLPRCIVGCHDPDRFPWNETYQVSHGDVPSDDTFQARMASLALIINSRNCAGYAGRVRVELDADAEAFMLELRFRIKQWSKPYYSDIHEAAGRAWENTLRIAVVLHVFCIGEGKVARDLVERAWHIAEWSLSQHRLIYSKSPRTPTGSLIREQAHPIRPIRVAQPKPPKMPRPLQDAQWLLTCLSRLWVPTKAVTVRELNQIAALPLRRLEGALTWLELEGAVLLTPHGKDVLITPIMAGHPMRSLGQ